MPTRDELPLVAGFEIRRRGYVEPDGSASAPLPGFAEDRSALVALYRAMVLLRAFDAKAVALQRTGRLGTYAVSLGQEAVSVGVASAMRPHDVFVPSYRETGALLWRGVKMNEHLLYWGGDEQGSNNSGPRHDFPMCVPVGSQAPHAAGIAYAMKLRRQQRVAVCMFGDGATSKGDVWEAMNFAGIHTLPVIFVIANNQWAISVPLRQQTAAETLAQRAIGAGFPGEQVDGNDVIAVRAAAEQAIATARTGGGPTLLECITYRLSDHTTADDAGRYRSEEEVRERWKAEPIGRMRRFLAGRDLWTKADEERLVSECQAEVEAAVERYLAVPARPPASMFDHLYERLPPAFAAQRDELRETGDG